MDRIQLLIQNSGVVKVGAYYGAIGYQASYRVTWKDAYYMYSVYRVLGIPPRALIPMTQLRVRFWFNLGDLSIFFIDGAV